MILPYHESPSLCRWRRRDADIKRHAYVVIIFPPLRALPFTLARLIPLRRDAAAYSSMLSAKRHIFLHITCPEEQDIISLFCAFSRRSRHHTLSCCLLIRYYALRELRDFFHSKSLFTLFYAIPRPFIIFELLLRLADTISIYVSRYMPLFHVFSPCQRALIFMP